MNFTPNLIHKSDPSTRANSAWMWEQGVASGAENKNTQSGASDFSRILDLLGSSTSSAQNTQADTSQKTDTQPTQTAASYRTNDNSLAIRFKSHAAKNSFHDAVAPAHTQNNFQTTKEHAPQAATNNTRVDPRDAQEPKRVEAPEQNTSHKRNELSTGEAPVQQESKTQNTTDIGDTKEECKTGTEEIITPLTNQGTLTEEQLQALIGNSVQPQNMPLQTLPNADLSQAINQLLASVQAELAQSSNAETNLNNGQNPTSSSAIVAALAQQETSDTPITSEQAEDAVAQVNEEAVEAAPKGMADRTSKEVEKKFASLLNPEASSAPQTTTTTNQPTAVDARAAIHAAHAQAQEKQEARKGLSEENKAIEAVAPKEKIITENDSLPLTGGAGTETKNTLGTLEATKVTTPNAKSEALQQAVVAQVKFAIDNARSSGERNISIELAPKELGRVDIHLRTNKEGKTNISISAENAETLTLLESQAPQLRDVIQSTLKTDSSMLNFTFHQGSGQKNSQQFADQFMNASGRYQNGNLAKEPAAPAPIYMIFSSNQRLDLRV